MWLFLEMRASTGTARTSFSRVATAGYVQARTIRPIARRSSNFFEPRLFEESSAATRSEPRPTVASGFSRTRSKDVHIAA